MNYTCIGSAPYQIEPNGTRHECVVYLNQIKRLLFEEMPAGVILEVSKLDDESDYEVRVYYKESESGHIRFISMLTECLPAEWDEQAQKELE